MKQTRIKAEVNTETLNRRGGGEQQPGRRRQVVDVDDRVSGGEAAVVDYRRSSALPEGRCGFEQSSRRFLGCGRRCCYFWKQLRKWACRRGCWQSFFPAPYWNQNKKIWMERGWRTLQQRCSRDDIWPVSSCVNMKTSNDTSGTPIWHLTLLILVLFAAEPADAVATCCNFFATLSEQKQNWFYWYLWRNWGSKIDVHAFNCTVSTQWNVLIFLDQFSETG